MQLGVVLVILIIINETEIKILYYRVDPVIFSVLHGLFIRKNIIVKF